MKKIISFITILFLLFMILLCSNTYAASLDTVKVETSKSIIKPSEEVKVTIDFGQELGAYTFDINYDKNIFEYVSVEGGTPNDTNGKLKVAFHDSTGGTNPRTNMSAIFKAKSDITTSNPTEFTVTAEGLANADASVTYDDITTPIVKNVTVEPQYEDYKFKLDYSGNIVKNQEKEMTLSYYSSMGHYYEHARLVAEVTTPKDANVKLVGKDDKNLEHDIIQSGWGDAQGYKIGGKDVSQVLKVKGIFSDDGDYTITLKLIDRDDSDKVIASQTFNFKVGENKPVTPEEKPETPETENEKKPTTLPQTGINIYLIATVILIILTSLYVYNNKKK